MTGARFDARSVYHAFAAAWARADLPALRELLADDAVYIASVGPEPGQTYLGREACLAGFGKMLRAEPVLESRIVDEWYSGTRGVVEWEMRVADAAAGARTLRGVDLLEFRSGRIVRKSAYRRTDDDHRRDQPVSGS